MNKAIKITESVKINKRIELSAGDLFENLEESFSQKDPIKVGWEEINSFDVVANKLGERYKNYFNDLTDMVKGVKPSYYRDGRNTEVLIEVPKNRKDYIFLEETLKFLENKHQFVAGLLKINFDDAKNYFDIYFI